MSERGARRYGLVFGAWKVDLEKKYNTEYIHFTTTVYAAIACFVVPYAPPMFRFF